MGQDAIRVNSMISPIDKSVHFCCVFIIIACNEFIFLKGSTRPVMIPKKTPLKREMYKGKPIK
jgi:hypothetical protein